MHSQFRRKLVWSAASSGEPRMVLTLPRCAHCGESKGLPHVKADHAYQRDARLPEWHGWHAARRGLGTNLYRLGVPDMVIQRILRHSNVSTTQGYHISRPRLMCVA